MNQSKARMSVVFGPETTIAVLEIDDGIGNWTEFVGDAKKHPRDEYSAEVGQAYAMSRALREAADWYRLKADRMVNQTNFVVTFEASTKAFNEGMQRLANLFKGALT